VSQLYALDQVVVGQTRSQDLCCKTHGKAETIQGKPKKGWGGGFLRIEKALKFAE